MLNTPVLMESRIAMVKFAFSRGVAGLANVNFGRYLPAFVRMLGSLHSFCASCCLARATGSQFEGDVLSPNVRPVFMMRVLFEIALCIATRLGLYLMRGNAH